MKVYIICNEPFPNGQAATGRIICYAKALILEGIDCMVITYYRTKNDPDRNPYAKGVFEKIPFLYIGGSTVKPSHKIPRILSEHHDKSALKSFLSKNLQQGDIVIGYVNSDIDFICPLIDIVHSKGAKYVRELCEIPYFGNNEKAKQEILEKLFPKCDAFICISESLTDIATKHKSGDAKIIKVPILVQYGKANIDDESDKEPVPYIFHCGTLYEQKDGISGMIEAFALAKHKFGKPVKLICTGNPKESPDCNLILETMTRFDVCDDIEFTGYLNYDMVLRYLSRATAVILNKYSNEQNLYCFSTKLGEYLAAGKAIVTSNVGEAMNWLSNGENALIVPERNYSAMADAIVELLSDSELRRRLGRNGKMTCKENFDFSVVAPKLAGFLRSL